MVHIKSQREIALMRNSGKLVSQILQQIAGMVKPGVTLLELDAAAESLTTGAGAKPAFKGYLGYRHTLCTSVNEQVVHGIPSQRKLEEGDIVGLDFGLVLNGYYGDSAVTVPVGKISSECHRLMKATRDSLYAAIEVSRPGRSLKDIALAIESIVSPLRYGVVREFVGHGIGQKLHEEPQVPNYSSGASPMVLKAGMAIAIEPMINEGGAQVKVLSDKWTAVTVDGRPSAHYEHTIIITQDEPEILTEWEEPRFSRYVEGAEVDV